MPSENASSADNQQERPEIIGWIVGFTDGEGCFSVSVIKNSTTRTGWQIFPEFVITQGEKSVSALKYIKKYFGCGNIYVNRRKDNHKENIYRYCVRSVNDLQEFIVPFFARHGLRTSKKYDFKKFAKIIGIIAKKNHLSCEGMKKIAKIIEQMNRKVPARFVLEESKRARFPESSETKRQSRS
jgi:hypothetical protein